MHSLDPSSPRCCTAIGSYAVDLHLLAEAGLLDDLPNDKESANEKDNEINVVMSFHPRAVFSAGNLDAFLRCERRTWIAVRDRLISLFLLDSKEEVGNDEIKSDHSERGESTTIKADDRLRTNLPLRSAALHSMLSAVHHVPCTIGDYTDFYSSREHATNVGTMFRGKDDALQPNWLHVPIGYHGRSSSVGVSSSSSCAAGRDAQVGIRRPCGQVVIDPADPKKGSKHGPTRSLDFELEVAFIVGGPTNVEYVDGDGGCGTIGRPMTAEEARGRIFGYVLLNDWSARDVQKWEYVPLGPFTSKNFATTMSPWIVTACALEPSRCATSAVEQDPVPLEYLRDPDYGEPSFCSCWQLREHHRQHPPVAWPGMRRHTFIDFVSLSSIEVSTNPRPPSTHLLLFRSGISRCENNTTNSCSTDDAGSYDVNLSVSLCPSSSSVPTVVCRSSLRNMYWSSVQQLVHHSVTGCPVRAGDLLASGTISGTDRGSFGSMLELSWGGTRDVELEGGARRRFLEDGDVVTMEGWCDGGRGPGRVGFGACSARVLPADPFPYKSREGRAEAERPPPQRYTRFRLLDAPPTSSWAWMARIALSAKGVPYETSIAYSSLEDGGRIEAPLEKSTTNTPMRRRTPTLEFVDGGNDVVRISGSNAIFDFLESAFPDRGGRLLPPDPVARARAREVADGIDSVVRYGGATWSISMRDIEDRLSSLEASLAHYAAVGGPFAIGTHGPNIADICLIPLLHDARRYGIDSGSYPRLTGIELACKDHPWFRGAATKSIGRGGETLEAPFLHGKGFPDNQGGQDGL